jgi:hypothetical protein
MRLVKDQILSMWEQRRAEAKDGTAEQDRRVKEIQQKHGRLDDGFLFAQSIDRTSYERQREELTLAQIDHHADATDELDIQGILACAERIPQRASDLWVHGSLDYKQRLQALFFPEGVGYDCHRFNRTAVTAPLFNYLAPNEVAEERVVPGVGIEPTHPFGSGILSPVRLPVSPPRRGLILRPRRGTRRHGFRDTPVMRMETRPAARVTG